MSHPRKTPEMNYYAKEVTGPVRSLLAEVERLRAEVASAVYSRRNSIQLQKEYQEEREQAEARIEEALDKITDAQGIWGDADVHYLLADLIKALKGGE